MNATTNNIPALKLGGFFRIPGEGKHLYEVEATNHKGDRVNLKVDANTRTVAAARCKRDGFKVGSMNMVG